MKKIMLKVMVLIIILFPSITYAYSNEVILGGKNIGIKIDYEGVLIIGFYKVNNKLNNENLKVGDYILEVNNNKINTVEELVDKIEENVENNEVILKVKRDNKEFNVSLPLIKQNDKYKTGLYVKDKISGIGTLTYIDPTTKIFGALGHEIIDSNTNKIVEVKTGSIYSSNITSIDRSTNGNPGSKNATIDDEGLLGSISKNTSMGIYGKYNDTTGELLSVALPNEIKKGSAKILTTLEDNTVKEYDVNITKIDKKNKTKNLYFEITDKELLNKTGGIVQGMSGSPITQDDKIIGAVTHVVVDDVKKGYGIFITTMLETGEEEE